MPDWWQELAEVPGIDNHQELAWEVWASFELPQQISEQHSVENYYQAPLVPPCICWKSFLPQHDPKFTSWDIRELQLEKMVAYAQALQFWVEKANLPTQGQPCLLAGSVVELRATSPSLTKPSSVAWLSQRNPQPHNQRKPPQECPTNADQLPC